MKIIVNDYNSAVAEVEKRVYAVLDKLPFENQADFFRLESDYKFRVHTSWTRGYTAVRDSGKTVRYLGRFGIGWSADFTGTTRNSYRTYCCIPLTLSDFIRPYMTRRDVLRFISSAERVGEVSKPCFGSLTPETRAYLARNVIFHGGARNFDSLWRGCIQSYVVNLSVLEAFCTSLDKQFFPDESDL